MKIIFMGSAAFAVPSLEALLQAGYDTRLVVTQPDKPAGRGLKVAACPVATFAAAKNLSLYQPKTLKDGAALEKLSWIKPDLIVVVSYGKMLPNAILELPPMGAINLHASLLPKYRGAAPINWAIANGEEKTGVTTMMVGEKMDAGDMLLKEETVIGADETAPMLHDRLAEIGANLLTETIRGLETKQIKRIVQNEAEATIAPILKKEDGLVNWNRSAREISNLIRGMQPWPVAYTHLEKKTLRIFGAVASEEKPSLAPGTVISADEKLAVATSDGTLYVTDCQLEGKKRMPVEAFLRGHKIKEGTRLG